MSLTWEDFILSEYKDGDYLKKIFSFIRAQEAKGKEIFPESSNVFSCFKFTPRDKVKVVILGQDPYHGPGQAHGLAFSVLPDVPIPMSLANIYKEIKDDTGSYTKCEGGFLLPWAKQGVLLLNTCLTVERGKPLSHAGIGWERFTDAVIRDVSLNNPQAIFVLWGNKAQAKASLLEDGQTILTAAHPSPLSAHNGFFGSKPFSYINKTLSARGESTIQW